MMVRSHNTEKLSRLLYGIYDSKLVSDMDSWCSRRMRKGRERSVNSH